WGFHWRVGVLWFAKWPYILLALCDVKLKRKFPYALTRKTKYISANTMLLLPNILVMTLICSAWVVGMINGRITNPFLHICALVSIGGCLALILSDRWHFPAPYDPNLQRHMLAQRLPSDQVGEKWSHAGSGYDVR